MPKCLWNRDKDCDKSECECVGTTSATAPLADFPDCCGHARRDASGRCIDCGLATSDAPFDADAWREDGCACTKCNVSMTWEGDPPEDAEDAICNSCLRNLLREVHAVAHGRSTDYPTRGHRINRKATIGARITELNLLIPQVEKLSRKTPPKTLLAEKRSVENAKVLLPKLVAEREALMIERVELEAVDAAAQKRGDGT